MLENYLEKPMQVLPIQIKKQLEFVLDLTANTYTNYSSMEICLPLKFTKKSNNAQQMDAQMITVNIFLGIGLLIRIQDVILMIREFYQQIIALIFINIQTLS